MKTPETKSDQRRRLRARRRALSPQEHARAARALTVHLSATRLFRASHRIGCYLPVDGEIDTASVIERIWGMRKICYLPVLSRLPAQRLWFAPAEPGSALAQNRFGIPEPVVHVRALVRALRLDLILLPLVGFDARGNRLGMGGGFYDHSLAFLRHRRCWRKPWLIGLAHDFQRVDAIRPGPWDVRLQAVVTDCAVYEITPGAGENN